MSDIDKIAHELGWSIRYFLNKLCLGRQTLFALFPMEIIDMIVDMTEERTTFKSKSQIMNYLNSSKYFIFSIKTQYLLKIIYIDGDKFKFKYINFNDLLNGNNTKFKSWITFRICRNFIKIYIEHNLICKMNKFFTIRKLNTFESSSITGRLASNLIVRTNE